MEFNRLDVSAKELIWDEPPAWLRRYGIETGGGVEVIDSDASTVTAAADKVLKVSGRNPFLVDLEPPSYHSTELERDLWLRQVVLDHRHNLPVLTVLILLCKRANSPRLLGRYRRELPDGWLTNRYNYRVVRLWREDPEDYMNAGVSLMPLAPLTNVSKAELPGLVRRIRRRIEAEPEPRANKLLTAAFFLMGLRYSDDLANHFLGGVRTMRESTTYRRVLRDGRLEEAQRIVLRQGTARFGTPDAVGAAAVEAISDLDRLEMLTERMVDPATRDWNDLLRSS